MKRGEIALLVFALVLLIGAWELSSDIEPPNINWNGKGIPWPIALWQFRHILASPLALVGLASAVGVLFFRAARWAGRPSAASVDPVAPQMGQQAD